MNTMEWTKQSEEMFKTWTDTQKSMWEDWFKTMQGFGASQSNEVWRKTVDGWSASINKTLDAQAEWTRMWAESANATKTPAETVEWAKQGQDMMKRWTETQRQLWSTWFDIVKKLDPGATWGQDGQKFLNGWNEAVKKAADTQAEWIRLWTAAGKKPDTGKTPGK
jgi:hypothetical protein